MMAITILNSKELILMGSHTATYMQTATLMNILGYIVPTKIHLARSS
jgi:hypothetical protein